LIDLLLENKVVYLDVTDPQNPRYIVPGYLPSAKADPYYSFLLYDLQETNVVLKFEHFIPLGFINKLICFYGEKPEEKLYWKDQLLYTTHRKQAKVLIQLDFEALTIRIAIQSKISSIDTDAILKETYYDIIALYWDEKSYWKDTNKEERIIKYKNNTDEERYYHRIENQRLPFPSIDSLLQKSIPDAYLSVDGEYFVSYDALHTETASTMFAYTINPKTKQMEKTNGKLLNTVTFKNFTNNTKIQKMKKLFISYSKEDLRMVSKFEDHLSALKREGKVGTWYCTELRAGDVWNKEIKKHFDEADIVCFMISSNFMRTDYIFDYEIKWAMEQHNTKKIVPIILKYCRWQTEGEYNLANFNGLPYTAKPIVDFRDEDMAWLIIVEALREIIEHDDIKTNNSSFYDDLKKKNQTLKKYFTRIVEGKVDNNSN
jgi:hypothetical protein